MSQLTTAMCRSCGADERVNAANVAAGCDAKVGVANGSSSDELGIDDEEDQGARRVKGHGGLCEK